MTTRLRKPLRRRIDQGEASFVVELTGEGIAFRRVGCRRRVLITYDEAIRLAIDREGYDLPDEEVPAEQLGRLRKRRQRRTLFSRLPRK